MKDKLIGYLSGKGVSVPANASEDDVMLAIGGALDNKTSPQVQPPPATPGGFVEPLIGCDPAAVTPARAGAVFAQFVKKLQTDEGCGHTEAWLRGQILKPELWARANGNKPTDQFQDKSALSNSDMPPPAMPPAQKPFVAAAFGLPPNVPDDLLAAAWTANRNQSASVNFKEIYLAAQVYVMKTCQCSADQARRQMLDDYARIILPPRNPYSKSAHVHPANLQPAHTEIRVER